MIKNGEKNKRNAAESAANFIEAGMIIGLGSGSTVYWMLKRLSERIETGLEIQGVATSIRTERWANELGIPLINMESFQSIDLAIDGADEIDNELNLIKGGGGSLVREKIVANLADKFIIVADHSKKVATLGELDLPVEVVPFGYQATAKKIQGLECITTLRKKEKKIFVSDNGNYILDCKFSEILNPKQLHNSLKKLVGVVETGLFINMADQVIIGDIDGVSVIKNN